MDIPTLLGCTILFSLMGFVFIALPIGLATPTKEQRQIAEWRKANGYE